MLGLWVRLRGGVGVKGILHRPWSPRDPALNSLIQPLSNPNLKVKFVEDEPLGVRIDVFCISTTRKDEMSMSEPEFVDNFRRSSSVIRRKLIRVVEIVCRNIVMRRYGRARA